MATDNKLANLVREGSLGSGMAGNAASSIELRREYNKHVSESLDNDKEPLSYEKFRSSYKSAN